MYYTMTSLEDHVFHQRLSIDKNGNKYVVGIHDRDTSTYKHRTFDNLAEAEQKFLYLARCIIHGNYSFEDRVKILEGLM